MPDSIPNVISQFPLLVPVYENALKRAEGGFTLGEILATINEAASVAVEAASKLAGMSGADKKALVDKAILALYAALRPSLYVAWWLPMWMLDPIIVAAIPHITESAYQVFKRFQNKEAGQ